MPWMNWLPWRFLARRAARAHGFVDPLELLDDLARFAQPSEVDFPLELLRAGVVFHARGLINSRVIQHNLDWVWPYWVERQFDPRDPSFVPRAFTITHVNLTHRNWTAVGVPDRSPLAIVDPCGLLTPLPDGWSLDAWILSDDGDTRLLPSRTRDAEQRLDGARLAVVTDSRGPGMRLHTRASMEVPDEGADPVCLWQVRAESAGPAWAVIALRPANPEGVSFVRRVELAEDRRGWTVNGRHAVRFDTPADRHHASNYRAGDVYIHLRDLADDRGTDCEVGMATAAAMFRLAPGEAREIAVTVPVPPQERDVDTGRATSWGAALEGHCRIRVPDPLYEGLYEAAIQTLVLHSPLDVYPGPYTYKRFWFRDAAFIVHALLCAGLTARAERALDRFPLRQDRDGYFNSQAGEWDSNGEALWILRRFCEITGSAPKAEWRQPILRAAEWIVRKRLPVGDEPHAGLLPAGFSAEHLGPNDYYYWDDFWGVAGLRAAADLAEGFDPGAGARFRDQAADFSRAIDRSLGLAAERLGRPGMPASPYRRLDAGAIGSLALGYPLQLCAADDPRLLDTAEFLLECCFFEGGFFQDMIHSGINPYLTLHVAQVLLRAGDPRHLELTASVAALASPTGQWPEAVHPRTLGGCMGDGQHVWAAAEWVLMLRNGFVREEGDRLVLGAGIAPRWLTPGAVLSCGPAPTSFGAVKLEIRVQGPPRRVEVRCRGNWHGAAPVLEVRLPGVARRVFEAGADSVELAFEEGRP